MPLVPIIYVLAFIGVVVLVQTIAGMVMASRDRAKSVNRRLELLNSGLSSDEVYATLVRRAAAPELTSERLKGLYDRADALCSQAGLSTTPLRLLMIAGGIAAGLWLVALVLFRSPGPGAVLNASMSLLAACTLALLGVYGWVDRKRTARLKKIEAQLPLALDIVNRAIRAGHPVISAVQLAAQQTPDPLGSEFGLVVDETSYGAEFREALENFATRTGSRDARYFAVAVGIQSETGGNLAEILEGLAQVIRERANLALKVKALASEGKASGWMLSALPVAMIAFQLLTNPKFYTSKFSDPIFWPVVIGLAFLYLMGWLTIRRILNFKY